jgi:hypothetical protein
VKGSCMYGSGYCVYVVLLGYSLARCKLIRVSAKPLDTGDTCSLLSFCRSANSLFSHEIYDYVDNVTTW